MSPDEGNNQPTAGSPKPIPNQAASARAPLRILMSQHPLKPIRLPLPELAGGSPRAGSGGARCSVSSSRAPQSIRPILDASPGALPSEILSKCEATRARAPGCAFRRICASARSRRAAPCQGIGLHQSAARPRSGACETSVVARSQRQVTFLRATHSFPSIQRVRVSCCGHNKAPLPRVMAKRPARSAAGTVTAKCECETW
jgi:hypothetical protein